MSGKEEIALGDIEPEGSQNYSKSNPNGKTDDSVNTNSIANSTKIERSEENEQVDPSNNKHDENNTIKPAIVVAVQENGWNTLFVVILGAEIGVLIRIAIDTLNTTYDPVSVFASMYSEFTGCIIMGIAVALEVRIRGFYLPIYPLLTTGMAGSVTTFSSWNQRASAYLTNLHPVGTLYFTQFVAFVSTMIIGFGLSVIGLMLGKHIGIWIDNMVTKTEKTLLNKPRIWDFKNMGNAGRGIMIFDIVSLLIVLIITIVLNSQRQITISILFAPVGASLRWALALKLNPKYPNFPLGTFTANIAGSIILSIMYVLPFITPAINQIQCDVIYAIQTGFCACLTTVSTFQNELFNLPNKQAYIYGFVSIIIAQIFQLIINGSVSGTLGNVQKTCLT